MKLFLDAHVSGRRIGHVLRQAGHDVRAADEERGLDGWTDEQLLELAASEGRVMVTFDVADFPDIARRWAEANRGHAGMIIVVGIDHGEFGTILRVIERLLDQRNHQAEWANSTVFASRTGT